MFYNEIVCIQLFRVGSLIAIRVIMRFISNIGDELFDTYACLILVLGMILACPIMILYQFEAYRSETFQCDTFHCEMSQFETILLKVDKLIRKGAVFHMKKNSLQFIITQLEEIRVSKNAEYSSGIANTLIQFINFEEPPETVELAIDSSRCANKINAIKELRMLIGCGLREAKDFVELGTPFLTTTDVNAALKAYKTMKQFTDVKIKGSPAIHTLFG